MHEHLAMSAIYCCLLIAVAAVSLFSYNSASLTTCATTVLPLTSQTTAESENTISVVGAGASLPATVYYEWLALYSYSRQKQPTDSVQITPSYTSYDSNLGKLVMFDQSHSYNYGTTEIELTSFEAKMNPTLATVPILAG